MTSITLDSTLLKTVQPFIAVKDVRPYLNYACIRKNHLYANNGAMGIKIPLNIDVDLPEQILIPPVKIPQSIENVKLTVSEDQLLIAQYDKNNIQKSVTQHMLDDKVKGYRYPDLDRIFDSNMTAKHTDIVPFTLAGNIIRQLGTAFSTTKRKYPEPLTMLCPKSDSNKVYVLPGDDWPVGTVAICMRLKR
jgi:hypothetical protein